MSVALLERRRRWPLDGRPWREDQRRYTDGGLDAGQGCAKPLEVDPHRARTLDQLITDTWEGVTVRKVVRCPACRGRMGSRVRASGEVEGGECLDCGARLS
jgi:hypothetical protein